VIDPTGKLAGRGAYLHQQRSCWEKGLKGIIATALKVEINPDDFDLLMKYYNSLPDQESQ
jgi:hypothetical protein